MRREKRVKITALLASCSMMFVLAAPMEVFADDLTQSTESSFISETDNAAVPNESGEAGQSTEEADTVPGDTQEGQGEDQPAQPDEGQENPGGAEEPQIPETDDPQVDPVPDPGQPQEPSEDEQPGTEVPVQPETPAEEMPVEDNTQQQLPSVSDFNIYTNPEAGEPTAPILFHKIQKVYAVAKEDGGVMVREGAGEENRAVGEMEKGALCYIIADADQEWIYIESGNVRGFVRADELVTGFWANAKVGLAGEDTMPLAKELVAAWENAAYTYAAETVYEVSSSNLLRGQMLQYAQQFLGNPYVWGGTSLTNGCDCSGFVQQIYRQFGYSLPRTSREQAQYGEKINVYDAQPGDLIYYAREDGYIYHVLMYMGSGKAINAASTQEGIRISDVDYSKVCWATRVINDSLDVSE